jgi:sugar-specific transcriptional regulator TrmB
MSMDVIDKARALIGKRLKELDEEKRRLQSALGELGGKRRGPGRPTGRKPATRSKGTSPKRRKRRGGSRADQAVALITKKPGISAAEIAKELKIKPNYLYRVLGDLEKEGRVKKEGRKYHPAG